MGASEFTWMVFILTRFIIKEGGEEDGEYKQCLLFIEYAKICVNMKESVKNARTHMRKEEISSTNF